MTDRKGDLSLSGDRDFFVKTASERLYAHPSDYLSEYAGIRDSATGVAPRYAAGVLLPIFRRSPEVGAPAREGEFVFQLIKRSSLVSQPGDLSCPGGMLTPRLDRLLGLLLRHSPFSAPYGTGIRSADRSSKALSRVITLFLANALREAWEEVRLPPFHIRLLGPLPTYSLKLFRRTIFPLAVCVTKPWTPKLNAEVDKIVEVPLASFFDPTRFGCLCLTIADPTNPANSISEQRPCLILSDADGGEEILWGATLMIIVHFLSITMGYHLPEWRKGRFIAKPLRSDYLTGQSHS